MKQTDIFKMDANILYKTRIMIGLVIVLLMFKSSFAQIPLGNSYESIFRKYNTPNFKIEKKNGTDPSFYGLWVKEEMPPYNNHVFYFDAKSNLCNDYIVTFLENKQLYGAMTILNGLFTYKEGKNNGEIQWLSSANPNIVILLLKDESGNGCLRFKRIQNTNN